MREQKKLNEVRKKVTKKNDKENLERKEREEWM